MECFHWTLKAAIMCHSLQQWTDALPLVLLGIRMAFNYSSKKNENFYTFILVLHV
jgi:hypothetical protein